MDHGARIFVLGSFVAACSVVVERFPSPGETIRASRFVLEPGGKGFNCAVGARLLGASVDGVLAVGEDGFAELARSALARFDLPDMLVRVAGPTGAGVGFIDGRGENCIAVFPGANDALSAGHIEAAHDRLARANLVLAQFEIGDAPIIAAFQAPGRKRITVLNPSPYRSIDPEILRSTDVVVVNEVEAGRLQDALGDGRHGTALIDEGAYLASRLSERGVGTLVITMGADGAIAWDADGRPWREAGVRVAAVDTIGAGDAFLAGFATALSDGLSLAECLRRGVACGALTVSRLGLLDALPTRDRLDAFLLRTAARAWPAD